MSLEAFGNNYRGRMQDIFDRSTRAIFKQGRRGGYYVQEGGLLHPSYHAEGEGGEPLVCAIGCFIPNDHGIDCLSIYGPVRASIRYGEFRETLEKGMGFRIPELPVEWELFGHFLSNIQRGHDLAIRADTYISNQIKIANSYYLDNTVLMELPETLHETWR